MQVTWVDLRREGPRLCDSDAALLALAQALVRWNHANAFSAATGEPMKAIQGGHARYGLCWLDEQRSGAAAAACDRFIRSLGTVASCCCL